MPTDFAKVLRELLDSDIEPRWTLTSIATRAQFLGADVDRTALSRILSERRGEPKHSVGDALLQILEDTKKKIAERADWHAADESNGVACKP